MASHLQGAFEQYSFTKLSKYLDIPRVLFNHIVQIHPKSGRQNVKLFLTRSLSLMLRKDILHQVQLLLDVLPLVMEQQSFALKGGTAINLFHRNMPRLSVDIDLCYLAIKDRETTLKEIDAGFEKIAQIIQNAFPLLQINIIRFAKSSHVRMLMVKNQHATIKVEHNTILRGSVHPPKRFPLCERAKKDFETFLEAQTLCKEDLYGGKICAALDRQHPRDLFDIKILLENEGLTEAIRKTFVIYLLAHNRAISDLLAPNFQEITSIFESEFLGMSLADVTCAELVEVRRQLVAELHQSLNNDERRFIFSMKQGNPNWDLMAIEGINQLPALQWKLKNIRRMKPDKRQEAVEKLKKILNL